MPIISINTVTKQVTSFIKGFASGPFKFIQLPKCGYDNLIMEGKLDLLNIGVEKSVTKEFKNGGNSSTTKSTSS